MGEVEALPVQELKIDKWLVMRMDQEKNDQQIVRSTIGMAHYPGLKVLAESVGNAQVLILLKGMACDAGLLPGPPVGVGRPRGLASRRGWYPSR